MSIEAHKFAEVYDKMNLWLAQPDLPAKTRRDLQLLEDRLAANSGDTDAREEIYDRFYRDLEFGTGGLRGVLGAGTNRMNIYTVRRTTQGLANYLKARYGHSGDVLSVAIAYDSRILSDCFAQEAAEVLAANGIGVYIYSELMPTPALSYAVRYYGCCGGIMITASHNPANYNGYKVYNREGCQVNLEEAEEILSCITQVDLFTGVRDTGRKRLAEEDCAISQQSQSPYIQIIPEETVNSYIEAVKATRAGVECGDIEVVYTPLNGAGNRMVQRILAEIGTGKVHLVPEQEHPDGNFPTCPYPNPEKEEALRKGLSLCAELATPDLLLATDPDCDRLGIAVRHIAPGSGEVIYERLTGNEVGALILDFLCARKNMPERPIAIRTIVSSRMADAVAKHYGVEMMQVLTGFKFIGEQVGLLEKAGEEGRFLFGFEESYGYLAGAYVRDKDAVEAAMLVTEAAAYYKKQGKTLIERMEELYLQHGYYRNDLMDFAFEGAKGMEMMAAIMSGLRAEPPVQMIGKKVVEIADYQLSQRRSIGGSADMAATTRIIALPKADVLEYILEDGSSVIARPSGTEPKLKVYLSAKGDTEEGAKTIIREMKETIKEWLPL